MFMAFRTREEMFSRTPMAGDCQSGHSRGHDRGRRERSYRPAVFWTRPHRGRRICYFSRASCAAYRGRFSQQGYSNHGREQRRQRGGVPRTLGKVGALPNIDIVITGHNATTLTIADVKDYAEFNREFLRRPGPQRGGADHRRLCK